MLPWAHQTLPRRLLLEPRPSMTRWPRPIGRGRAPPSRTGASCTSTSSVRGCAPTLSRGRASDGDRIVGAQWSRHRTWSCRLSRSSRRAGSGSWAASWPASAAPSPTSTAPCVWLRAHALMAPTLGW